MQEYIVPWAESMGFVKILATRMEVDDQGKLTGKFLDKNCNGSEKVQRVKECLGDLGQYNIYVYGDSRGDSDLLKIADHPFYRSFNKEKASPYI